MTVATLYSLKGPDKGCTYQTDDDYAVIGRTSDQVQLTDDSVSRHHAELRRENGFWVLSDRRSANGTYLNGRRIQGPTRLQHGDQIKVGASVLVFSGKESAQQTVGPRLIKDLVELDLAESAGESAILSAVDASEDSVTALPAESADQIAACNLMYKIAEMMGADSPVEDFLQRLADIILDHLTVDALVLLMADQPSNVMTPKVVRYRASGGDSRPKISTSQRIIDHVVTRKEGILCADAMSDDRFAGGGSQDSIHRLGLRSVICVPIIARNEVLGVCHLDCSMSQHTYTPEQLRLAVAVGRMAGLALDNARLLESRVRHERLAATGEAVAHLSHQIRNILQGLQSGADIVDGGLARGKTESVRTGWRIVKRGIERSVVLTTNMLTFSKDRTPRIQPVQLNQVITDIVAATQPRADQKSVMILTELEEIPEIQVGLHGVQQVVLNLLLNAVDAVPEQTGRINLRTEYDAKSRSATFIISDNGPGIPPELMTRIFEPFFSTKGHAGTGLGLAAANKVVQELHGRIDVQSSPDQGTTFRVVFPDWNKTEPTDTDQVS